MKPLICAFCVVFAFSGRDISPLSWGERFQDQAWVNRAAMQVIAESGGHA
jgi:hypothetical protein